MAAVWGTAIARASGAPLATWELRGSWVFWLLYLAFFVVMALIVHFQGHLRTRKPNDRLPRVGR